ncbi:hypothetical protein ALC56_00529 [Trachymyrmex septentrionalis]|uniref:Uncharacterized protein n=1 Tax=Trachymyrmex septentrionalis TaxID=34720 RepID=A0A195FWL0_9HYME|nr:hypothetical protein ALC56_00529 [Trachymyrmex septentrionalis]
MHCFPVQCRIHIHVVRVFVSARVYYVRRTAGEGDSAGSSGAGAPLIDASSVAPRITGCLRSLGYTIVLA